MTGRSDKRPPRKDYEVGYGKPPLIGRFVKGVSGNPRGRPKKARPASPQPDTSARDRFLAEADRMITITEGGIQTQMPVAGAVLRAETVAALKGNALAQRHFLERDERYRAERAAEIAESHAFWREYVEAFSAPGKEIPKGLPHPEDIVFEAGKFVEIRGGDPATAEKNWAYLCQLRDTLILQAERDERHYRIRKSTSPNRKCLYSGVFAMIVNSGLPPRHRFDDSKFLWATMKAETIRQCDLKRMLRKAWGDMGIPRAMDAIFPLLDKEDLKEFRP